jgi:DNA-binding XRE family transcriptional regulator
MARPRAFKSVEELEERIAGYFFQCDNRIVEVHSKTVGVQEMNKPAPYSVEGLCGHLGVTRETLLNYEKEEGYEEFFDTIKKAKAKILANLMDRGLDGENSTPMTIFNLKNNYGYADKSSVDLKIDGKELSDEELEQQIQKFESRNK